MRGNKMGRGEHSFLFIPLKSQIFIFLKLGGMRGNKIKFNEFFTKTLCGTRELVTSAHFALGPKARVEEGHCRKHTVKVQMT